MTVTATGGCTAIASTTINGSSGRRIFHTKFWKHDRYDFIDGTLSIVEENDWKIWAGGYNNAGFIYFENGTWHKPNSKILQTERVLSGAFSDQKGRIYYFGERSLCINIIENKTHKLLNIKDNNFTRFEKKETMVT